VNGVLYERLHNFVVFRNSFFDLINYKDLYASSEGIFKYSPTFALLMAPFSLLPYWAGVLIWNLLNALCLFIGVKALPHLSDRLKSLILLYSLIELTTSVQNAQSNALIVGLILCAFTLLEKEKYSLSALCIVMTVYIKPFGLIAFVLFIFYPGKRRFIIWLTVWMLLFFLVPLMVINDHQLVNLYKSWFTLLKADHTSSNGLSIFGWLQTWFGINANKYLLTIAGFLLLCLPVMRIDRYKEYLFRLGFLSSILVWTVIFNHRAESPTFIIAVVGISLWYFSSRRSLPKDIVIVAVFILTQLSQTDVFPLRIKKDLFMAFNLKVFPCIVAWFYIVVELSLTAKFSKTVDEQVNK